MTRLAMICEGQTEASFANELLKAHLAEFGIFLTPTLIGPPGKKGGGVTLERLTAQIRELLRGSDGPYCTTFIDYYGLRTDFPGKAEASAIPSLAGKQAAVCAALANALAESVGEYALQRFIPYVQMHEFEALLFSDTAAMAKAVAQPGIERALGTIRDGFDTPEHIDDDPATAPSKRIMRLFPDSNPYEKVLFGLQVARDIGLPAMREACPLFDGWIEALESLAA